jgi:hypothetical protein
MHEGRPVRRAACTRMVPGGANDPSVSHWLLSFLVGLLFLFLFLVVRLYDPQGVFERLHETAYQGSKLADPVLGTKASVSAITAGDLSAYVKANYTGSRVVVSGAGAVNHKEVRHYQRCCIVPSGTASPVSSCMYHKLHLFCHGASAFAVVHALWQLSDLSSKLFSGLSKGTAAGPADAVAFIGSDIRVRVRFYHHDSGALFPASASCLCHIVPRTPRVGGQRPPRSLRHRLRDRGLDRPEALRPEGRPSHFGQLVTVALSGNQLVFAAVSGSCFPCATGSLFVCLLVCQCLFLFIHVSATDCATLP